MSAVALASRAESPLAWTIVLVASLAVGLGLPLAPAAQALRARRALRDGIHVEAEVIEIAAQSAKGMETLDALEGGFTAGSARVTTPSTARVVRFEIDAAWGRDVTVGSRLLGLSAPDGRRVAFWLGRIVR